MEWETRIFEDIPVRTARLNTVVVGTGAAGWNAALRLAELGCGQQLALVTEGVNTGTSRNAGSDKQTYYKLSLSGSEADSPDAMARDLFAGRCVDGDIAYTEAALSARCFLHLAELGVAFPTNRYGEYVGYKTDHDPRARATSAGPLTSRQMTECLEAAVRRLGVPVLDQLLVVRILKTEGRVCGLLALDLAACGKKQMCFVLLRCSHVVFATGGPAGIYDDTVYPVGHFGASGVLFEAGAVGKNLTEWQYGLASVAPRWNVSGTYMQVLPAFVSVEPDGTEHEFLNEYFRNLPACLSAVFQKGYEWPFDSRRTQNGSSVIDLLVYRETVQLGRRVYLDYRRNPAGLGELPYAQLSAQAQAYLQSAGACFGTPIRRLLHMNEPAVQLYRSKGVDLASERLEIALCAQHNNGGVGTDLWWQTAVPGLFAAGEVVGSHGVYRPGGSALNAGQVGSLRAAQYIARHWAEGTCTDAQFDAAAGEALAGAVRLGSAVQGEADTAGALLLEIRRQMSRAAGAIRQPALWQRAILRDCELLNNLEKQARVPDAGGLPDVFRLRDALIAQLAYLCAMRDFSAQGGGSRGSAIYLVPGGPAPRGLPEFGFVPDSGALDAFVQETAYKDGVCTSCFRPVRPLPQGGGFFENVWRSYRETGNID